MADFAKRYGPEEKTLTELSLETLCPRSALREYILRYTFETAVIMAAKKGKRNMLIDGQIVRQCIHCKGPMPRMNHGLYCSPICNVTAKKERNLKETGVFHEKTCACGCGKVFRVLVKPGRSVNDTRRFDYSCRQKNLVEGNSPNRHKWAKREERPEKCIICAKYDKCLDSMVMVRRQVGWPCERKDN
jgi:hypothetical protein